MENKQQQILEEIKDVVASLKNQIKELELKLAMLQTEEGPVEEDVQQVPVTEVDTEDVEMEVSIDIDDDLPFFDEPVAVVNQSMEELEPADLDEIFEPESSAEVPQAVNDIVAEEVAEPMIEEKAEDSAPVAVIDAMVAKQAWRTDMPGTSVKDIRSAISLNDRILFINYLFNEDPMIFQETLTALNSMQSFDEAADYVISQHPEWNLESDTVYRFMMALRRRLQ